MVKFIRRCHHLIPLVKRKKISLFFFLSLLNSLLDFISIAILTPFVLVLLDKQKMDSYLSTNFKFEYNNTLIISSLALLIFYFILKNILQTRIINYQNKFIYSIGSTLSKNLVSTYIKGKYENTYESDKGQLIRDFHRIPIVFATNILIPISQLLIEFIIIILVVITGVLLNPIITLSAISFITVCIGILYYLRKNKTTRINDVISSSYSNTLSKLMNIFNGVIDIKGSKSEDYFITAFDRSNKKHNEILAELSTFKQNNIKYLEIMVIFIICISVVLVVQFDSSSIENKLLLSFFASSILKLIPSFNKIINAVVDIKSNLHVIPILSSYVCQQEEFLSKVPTIFNNQISLKDVSFHYPEKSDIIEQISLDINSGDFMVITGTSGCGKTTLLHIIGRYLINQSGAIMLDGKNSISKKTFPFVYLVSQQPYLFQGTLLENIIMSQDETVDIPYIDFLVKQVGLEDWISTLKNGLHTEFHQDSKHLSGGQKQRIALIRALYAKPKLLLLDEATNQLNQELNIQVLSFIKNEAINKGFAIVSVFHNRTAIDFATKHYNFVNKKLVLQ